MHSFRRPDRNSPQGRRDYALLLFLYNTGARADEAAQVSIGDLRLAEAPRRDHSSVQIRGKGNKLRFCPLWTHQRCAKLEVLVGEKAPTEHVFLQSIQVRPLTRLTFARVESSAGKVQSHNAWIEGKTR